MESDGMEGMEGIKEDLERFEDDDALPASIH
jgi:hypothetical protein